MDYVTLRNRQGVPYNFEQLYVSGIDIAELIKQSSLGPGMSYSPAIVVVTERYQAASPGIGYSIGDIIRRTELIDTSTTPSLSTVNWFNFSTNATLLMEPVFTTLVLQQQSALSNAELRAAPVIIKTDATSPDLVLLGNLSDEMSPVDGLGNYSILAALKRTVSTLGRIASGLPEVVGQLLKSQSTSVVIASDQEAVFASQAKQDDMLVLLNQVNTKLPELQLGKVPMVAGDLEWANAGFTLDAAGNLVSETQNNGGTTRTRMWTTTTDVNGNVIMTASAWV